MPLGSVCLLSAIQRKVLRVWLRATGGTRWLGCSWVRLAPDRGRWLDVSAIEMEATQAYRGKIAFCITEGFMAEESGFSVAEQAEKFLLTKQRESTRQHSLVLQHIRPGGTALVLHFSRRPEGLR